MSETHRTWLLAADAARLLGVSRATLYAYVSRGFIRSQSSPGSTRNRTYAHEDVERLRRRTEDRAELGERILRSESRRCPFEICTRVRR